MVRVVVFGGYGVFGALVARELARIGVAVVVAGRDRRKAETLARRLGPQHRAVAADVRDLDSCRAALKGHAVAVNCAGPFADMNTALLEACLEVGCHYVDIADDRAYVARVRGMDERFRQRGLAAAYGCSSLPGISGALALMAIEGAPGVAERARVTLWIGNRNPKGTAAVESLVANVGNPITAPQGILRGFGECELVPLPPPFGRCLARTVESPEYDLFEGLLGVRAVSVKVSFEMTAGMAMFALLARLPWQWGGRMARVLARVGNLAGRIGSSGGAVMTELFFVDGSVRRAAMLAREEGQRMAALPCALAVDALCRRAPTARGAVTAYELLGAGPLLDRLVAEGYELHR